MFISLFMVFFGGRFIWVMMWVLNFFFGFLLLIFLKIYFERVGGIILGFFFIFILL